MYNVKSRLSADEKASVSYLVKSIERKTIGSPEGFEPPSLSVLIDRVQWALRNEGKFTKIYLDIIEKDLQEVVNIVTALNYTLTKETDDGRNTILGRMAARDRRKKA